MSAINTDKTELRKFGITFFVVLLHISLIPLYKGNMATFWKVFGVADAFLLTGLIIPGVLKYIYIAWMKFGLVMNFIVTRIIFGIMYYLVFTPISVFFKIIGRDELDERWDKEAKSAEGDSSYWVKKPSIEDVKDYFEHQY